MIIFRLTLEFNTLSILAIGDWSDYLSLYRPKGPKQLLFPFGQYFFNCTWTHYVSDKTYLLDLKLINELFKTINFICHLVIYLFSNHCKKASLNKTASKFERKVLSVIFMSLVSVQCLSTVEYDCQFQPHGKYIRKDYPRGFIKYSVRSIDYKLILKYPDIFHKLEMQIQI